MNIKEIYEQRSELENIFNNYEQVKARELTNEYVRMLHVAFMKYNDEIKYIVVVLLPDGNKRYLYAPSSLCDIIYLMHFDDESFKDLNVYLEEVETFIKFKMIDLKDGKKYIKTLMK